MDLIGANLTKQGCVESDVIEHNRTVLLLSKDVGCFFFFFFFCCNQHLLQPDKCKC